MNRIFLVFFLGALAVTLFSWYFTHLVKLNYIGNGVALSRKGVLSYEKLKRAETRHSNRLFKKELKQLKLLHSVNIFLVLLTLMLGVVLYFESLNEMQPEHADFVDKYNYLMGWDKQ